jgi:hypothetical protein
MIQSYRLGVNAGSVKGERLFRFCVPWRLELVRLRADTHQLNDPKQQLCNRVKIRGAGRHSLT